MILQPALTCLLFAGCTLFSELSLAVLPPQYESRNALGRIETAAQQRSDAPVVARLKVLKTKVKTAENNRCPSQETWKVKAEVLSVTRGPLKADQTITLNYTRTLYYCPGPIREEVPALDKGAEVEAYLACDGKKCEPAAGAMSFEGESDFAKERESRKAEAQHYSGK